ncbi:tRNA(Ile)-lysidine synthase [Jannaschia pohangensis]|uniref:tRNA(Ile)-lysidine synthase n=1 Tax=Jannaschia pohangensis TaxID=390807 RepID=A0A1I3LYP4_9RHOB|nr:tRNA(Ile)-lysidine synthase [Jannaschia pohangensis]
MTPAAAIARLFDGPLGGGHRRFGIAVSGGGDSLALLLSAQTHAQSTDRSFRVATVDHGLRPEAVEEARQVAALCAERGIAHDILTLALRDGPDLQARARQARYAALGEWAAQHHLSPVLLGHTQDDVAESLVMRLRRGVGLEGLAEMPECWTDARGQTWARPFLSIARLALRDILARAGITPIEDPSNEDSRFERVEIRKALAMLGWSDAHLARSARHLAEAAQAYNTRLADLAEDVFVTTVSDVVLQTEHARELAASEPDSLRRLLLAALAWIGGRATPRADEQKRLLDYVADPATGGITLAGCRIMCDAAGVRLFREEADCPPEVKFGKVWDRRWLVEGPVAPGLTIGALGRDIDQTPWRGGVLPRASAMTTPAIRQDGSLLAAPAAGLPGAYRIKVEGSVAAALRRREPIFN